MQWHQYPSGPQWSISGQKVSAFLQGHNSVAPKQEGQQEERTVPAPGATRTRGWFPSQAGAGSPARGGEGRRHQVSWWHFPPAGTTHRWLCQPPSRRSRRHPGAAGNHLRAGGSHIVQASSPGKNNPSITNGESQEMLLLCRSRCQRTAEQGAGVYF